MRDSACSLHAYNWYITFLEFELFSVGGFQAECIFHSLPIDHTEKPLMYAPRIKLKVRNYSSQRPGDCDPVTAEDKRVSQTTESVSRQSSEDWLEWVWFTNMWVCQKHTHVFNTTGICSPQRVCAKSSFRAFTSISEPAQKSFLTKQRVLLQK